MSLVPFDTLPPESRLYAFNAERALADVDMELLRENLERFLQDWTAHRKELTVGYDLRLHQFILIAIDESKLPPSGCSIDTLMRFLRDLGAHMRVELLDSPDICFLDSDIVRCVNRAQFAALAEHGDVGPDTIVFDNTISRLRDLNEGRWQIPAARSWHGQAFELA